jgi:MFS family permease
MRHTWVTQAWFNTCRSFYWLESPDMSQDRYSRKYVLMASLAFNALAALGLAWNSSSGGSIYVLYACLFAAGTAKSFWMPARQAFLPRIVPMDIFSNAVSWNTSGFEIATMTGPALGGFLIAIFKSPTPVYALNAIAGLTFMLLVSRIAYKHIQERSPVTLKSLLAGFQFIRKTNIVFSAMMLDMFGVMLGGATALMPIYADQILKVGPQGLGWLMAAPAIGACTMAVLQAHHGPLKRAGLVVLLAVAGFGGSDHRLLEFQKSSGYRWQCSYCLAPATTSASSCA